MTYSKSIQLQMEKSSRNKNCGCDNCICEHCTCVSINRKNTYNLQKVVFSIYVLVALLLVPVLAVLEISHGAKTIPNDSKIKTSFSATAVAYDKAEASLQLTPFLTKNF